LPMKAFTTYEMLSILFQYTI